MVTGAISACVRGCTVVALLAGVACSARAPYSLTRSPAADAVEDTDSLAAARSIEEHVDSSSAAENGSVESDLLDAVENGTPAAHANEALVEDVSAVRTRHEDVACEMSAIAGCRIDARVRADGWHALSGGFGANESGSTGYAGIGGRGVLEGLHVGRFTVRAGERVVLGRGIGSYATSGSGSVRGGFALSPSLSRWFGANGAALGLGWEGWRCHTIVVSGGEGNRTRPQSVWVSVVKRSAWGTAGVTAGEPLEVGDPESLVPRGGGTAPAMTRPRVVSCHASFRDDGLAGSFEIAHLSRQMFFAARASQRVRASRGRWAVLFFRVPYTSPMGTSGLEPVTKADQGVRLDLSSRLGGLGASTVLIAGRAWSPSRLRMYRRLFVALEGGRRPVRWEVCAHARSDSENEYPAGAIGREIPTHAARELRFRATVGMSGTGGLDATARIEYLPAIDAIASGVLLSLATEIAAGPIEGRVQLSAHSLPRGRQAFASRPGIGPFESLAPLSGNGSDLSVRFRARIRGGAALVFFYGSEWLETERLYVGAEYRR